MSTTLRTRWAAIGAAVAVTLGAGGIGFVDATQPDGASAFVPIEPCRLADIRPNTIGPGGSMTFDGWGTTGDCTLPAGTTGLALNVTAVGATQQTNLRFHPAGTPTPETANLNPTPGAPPTPNAVNVTLNSAGQFAVYNRFGSVAVVIDAMGYYTDHDHDDRYLADPGRQMIHPTAFQIPEGSTWSISNSLETLGHSSGSNECVHAPLDIPVGSDVTEVSLRYNASGGASTAVHARGLNAMPGVYTGPSELISTIAGSATPVALTTAPSEVVAYSAPLAATPTILEDWGYTLEICTADNITITGAVVSYG